MGPRFEQELTAEPFTNNTVEGGEVGSRLLACYVIQDHTFTPSQNQDSDEDLSLEDGRSCWPTFVVLEAVKTFIDMQNSDV